MIEKLSYVRWLDCDCRTWADDNIQRRLLGNSHHYRCPHFVPDENALNLLRAFVKGVQEWAVNRIPDFVWEPYQEAYFILNGKFPEREFNK